MKKILITGGSGLLGQYLNIFLSKEFEIKTLYNTREGNAFQYNSAKTDITDADTLKKTILDYKPNIVIHTAAVSNPASALLLPPKYVYDVNVNATSLIAKICDRINARLIYTSTDLVYAGYRGSMLKEDSKLVPISLYAETKLMGEVKISEVFDNYIILRTALLFGFGLHGSLSFFHQMYLNLKEQQPVNLFIDQFRTPMSVIEAAKAISRLVTSDIKAEVLNFGGRERVSRFELGEILCNTAGFNKNLLKKISMQDIEGLPAVEDVSMNTDKLISCGINIKSIEESIQEILNFEQDKK